MAASTIFATLLSFRSGMGKVYEAGLAVPLGADEAGRADDHEDHELGADDRQIRWEIEQGYTGAAPVVDVAQEVDGVAHRRDLREDVEEPRKVLDRIEDPGQEELRQHHEREDLVRLPLVVQTRQHEDPEGAAVHRDEQRGRDQRDDLLERERHPDDHAEREDRDELRERDERLAEDLSEDDRVPRDRRAEDLLTEDMLAVHQQRDAPQ